MSSDPPHSPPAPASPAAHAPAGAHAAPPDAHAKGPGRGIGITMALLGVMLALCAALVGSHRTDLIKTTVVQANAWGLYQAEAMKLRVIEGDVELLHAVAPNPTEEWTLETNLRSKRAPGGKPDDEDTAEIKDLVATSVTDLAELLTPDPEDERRLEGLARRYAHDMAEAKEDAEAYDQKIEAHSDAAEWFERSQLLAEIGIVVSAVALLLANKRIWYVAMSAGLAGAVIIAVTSVRTHHQLAVAERTIADAAKRSTTIEADDEGGGAAPATSASAPPSPAKE